MKKNEKIKNVVLIISVMIIIFLIIYIPMSKAFLKTDKDYQKLELGLDSYNIDYYIVYEDDPLQKYEVYKLNMFGEKEKFRDKLEESSYWNKNKFYEYEILRFYEIVNNDIVNVDRDDVYYYHNNGAYAIFDLKNEKLYYLKSYLYGTHNNYREILGVEAKNYTKREIYSVREGLQYDGIDYYVYGFPEEKGQDIIKRLDNDSKWSKDKLEDSILDHFIYNKEVFEIKNGYYHYELVCRTRDKNKKKNITKENATGCEIGVYDVDKNILYYYWDSI